MDIANYRKDIEDAIAQEHWEFGNGILYKMCREYPRHDTPDVVSGKVWLIGRAYSAAIERRKSKKSINDDFYEEEVGPSLADPALDGRLEKLRKEKGVTKDNLGAILSVHKYLLIKIEKITGMEKRSLCSKYLHFHLPALFFIYDSRAKDVMQKLYPRRSGLQSFDEVLTGDVDGEYAEFFCKALTLKNKVQEKLNFDLTPRQLDNFLLKAANKVLAWQKQMS